MGIEGAGTAHDPFVLSADVDTVGSSNATFVTTISGDGTTASPWDVEVTFAETASLGDLPDVDVTGASNGQVLTFDSADQTWKPAAPAVAEAGQVSIQQTLIGDGSAGSPLGVKVGTGITGDATGVRLSDTSLRRQVVEIPTIADWATIPANQYQPGLIVSVADRSRERLHFVEFTGQAPKPLVSARPQWFPDDGYEGLVNIGNQADVAFNPEVHRLVTVTLKFMVTPDPTGYARIAALGTNLHIYSATVMPVVLQADIDANLGALPAKVAWTFVAYAGLEPSQQNPGAKGDLVGYFIDHANVPIQSAVRGQATITYYEAM